MVVCMWISLGFFFSLSWDAAVRNKRENTTHWLRVKRVGDGCCGWCLGMGDETQNERIALGMFGLVAISAGNFGAGIAWVLVCRRVWLSLLHVCWLWWGNPRVGTCSLSLGFASDVVVWQLGTFTREQIQTKWEHYSSGGKLRQTFSFFGYKWLD